MTGALALLSGCSVATLLPAEASGNAASTSPAAGLADAILLETQHKIEDAIYGMPTGPIVVTFAQTR